MDAKHTPGPWMVTSSDRPHGAGRDDVLAVRGAHQGNGISSVLAEVTCDRPGAENRGEARANAALIAAAPDLLAALRELEGVAGDAALALQARAARLPEGPAWVELQAYSEDLSRKAGAARAAIAKAEGRAEA
jgi:hypothetical protein